MNHKKSLWTHGKNNNVKFKNNSPKSDNFQNHFFNTKGYYASASLRRESLRNTVYIRVVIKGGGGWARWPGWADFLAGAVFRIAHAWLPHSVVSSPSADAGGAGSRLRKPPRAPIMQWRSPVAAGAGADPPSCSWAVPPGRSLDSRSRHPPLTSQSSTLLKTSRIGSLSLYLYQPGGNPEAYLNLFLLRGDVLRPRVDVTLALQYAVRVLYFDDAPCGHFCNFARVEEGRRRRGSHVGKGFSSNIYNVRVRKFRCIEKYEPKLFGLSDVCRFACIGFNVI